MAGSRKRRVFQLITSVARLGVSRMGLPGVPKLNVLVGLPGGRGVSVVIDILGTRGNRFLPG